MSSSFEDIKTYLIGSNIFLPVLISMLPPECSYVETLSPNVIALGGGIFVGRIGLNEVRRVESP